MTLKILKRTDITVLRRFQDILGIFVWGQSKCREYQIGLMMIVVIDIKSTILTFSR